MTYEYYCIVCGNIQRFRHPLIQVVCKCPWCGVSVETRELKDEQDETRKQGQDATH